MYDRLGLKLLLLFAMLVFNMDAADFNWTAYPSFTVTDEVAVMPSEVYFVSAGNLFILEKSSTVVSHEKQLTGNVKSLFIDGSRQHVAVALDNGYIEIIDKAGDIIEITSLRDVGLESDNVIENIYFDDDNLLVATCSGPVVIDRKKDRIVNSGNYRKPINAFIGTPENYYLCFDHSLYVISKNSDLRISESLKKIAYSDCVDLFPVAGGKRIFGISDNDRGRKLVRYDIDQDGNVSVKEFEGIVKSPCIIKNEDSGFGVTVDNRYFVFDKSGEIQEIVQLGDDVEIMAQDGDNYYWGKATDGGLQQFKKKNNSIVVNSDSYVPDAIRVKSVDILKFDLNNNLIAATVTPYSRLGELEDKNIPTPVDILKSGTLFDNIAHITDIAPHPGEESTIFIGSYTDGLLRVKKGETEIIYNEKNSPLKKWWGCSAEGLTFDEDGNLWVVAGYDVSPALMMLPAQKTLGNAVTADWIVADVSPFTVQLDGSVKAVGDIIVVSSSDYRKGLLFYNRSTGKKLHITNFTDTDGLTFLPDYIYRTFVDRLGRLWAVTSSGVFYIKNPESFFSRPTDSVVRPKINRDDSTSLADHALNGVVVVDMTEDGAGQKWIASRYEGLYLFNEDCTAMLQHFTTDNSPLLTDEIKSVIADNENGVIYVGTPSGLFHVESNAPLPAQDFTRVKIYPNPVKPGYTGNVTVDNLLADTLIKLVDSRGNNILTVMSTGGRAVFNVSSVKSGVYHILATSGADNSKIIGKLLIIR